MSANVWRGIRTTGVAGTGNGAWVDIPWVEVDAAPFCAVDGAGLITFSEDGGYFFAVTGNTVTGSANPDRMSMKLVTSGGDVDCVEGLRNSYGWAAGAMVTGLFALTAGQTAKVQMEIFGMGSNSLSVMNRGEDYGCHILIGKVRS